MRLIDADELIKGRIENDPVRIAAAAMYAPTAYDLDKVVEQLESQKNQHFRRAEEIKNKFGESYESQRLFSKACSYDNAIQIVKSGLKV